MQFDKLTDPIDYTEENFIGAKVLLITSMSFLGISYGLILLLWFFMVFDTILGLIASIVINGWQSLTQTRFWAGILTKISILFIPLSLAITGALAGFNLNIFVFSSIYVLIANDAISCFTNLLSIKTKKRYINRDLVEILINALRTSIYKFAEGIITKIKKE
jgi:phage-related holin